MLAKRIVLGLSAIALPLVLAAPASAQIINQPSLSDGSAVILNLQPLSIPTTSLSEMIGQSGINYWNSPIIPPGGIISYMGIGPNYSIFQESGSVDNNYTLELTVRNSITVDNALLPALSTVIAGGYQTAANYDNRIYIAPLPGATGTLAQVASFVTMSATNVMTATVTNGNASVIGNAGVDLNGAPIPGFQQAYNFLNTAGVLADSDSGASNPASTLAFVQKLGAPNTLTATNLALANSVDSTSTTLDPTIATLHQDSQIRVHQFDIQSVVDGNGDPTVTNTAVDGFQGGGLTRAGDEVGLTAIIGNVAVAYTGPTNGADYNIGHPAVGGDGTAVINDVRQNTVFSLNAVTGGPGAGLTLSGSPPAGWVTANLPWTGAPAGVGDGFLQYVDANTISVQTQYDNDAHNTSGANLTGIVNVLAARVDIGSASITGTVRTQASDPTTQSFANQLNSISIGGNLSGTATQAVLGPYSQQDIGPGAVYRGYVNVAVANANNGPAGLTNVSQSMSQSLNTVRAPSAVDFNLTQGAVGPDERGCILCSNNIQVAAGSSQATISGAQQFLNNTVNVAALGGLYGNSNITQNAYNVNLSAVNQLATLTAGNASISGIQSSFNAVNVIGPP
jgi:hypothetical protein